MHDVIILGAGPAGISAGVYTARAKLRTLVIGKFSESRLALAHKINNYFGTEGIEGKELLKQGTKQAKKLGAEILEGEVVDVKVIKQGFEVKDEKNKSYQAKALIIATGSKIETTNIKNEKELTSKGVRYCAICDGPVFNKKTIAVVGSGNHAAQEALILSAYSKDLTMIAHNNKFNMSNKLMKEVKKRKIKMIEGKILEFKGQNKLESIKMKNGEIRCDAAFIATGTTSSTNLARKLGLELKNGSILINDKAETSMEGVYAAGEATGQNKQVAICVGEGANAGVSAIKYLRNKETYTDYG